MLILKHDIIVKQSKFVRESFSRLLKKIVVKILTTLKFYTIENFIDKFDCKIILVFFKVDNSDLNLVAISQIMILDFFWNSYIEKQTIDCAHRIDQLRSVKVHRILIFEIVENRILQLQKQKRKIIEEALDEKAAANITRLSERELAFLFVRVLFLCLLIKVNVADQGVPH